MSNQFYIQKLAHATSFIVAITLFAACSQPVAQQAPAAPELPVLAIKTDQATTYQDYPAAIEGVVNVEIRPQVDGTLERIFVDEGTYVAKGQPLFKINDTPYRERLNTAKASEHAAEGALTTAQLEIEKLTPLVANKVVSAYQLKVAKAALSIAKADLERAKAEVGSAKINLGYTLITAPVSGYIGRLEKKQGSLVGPADPTSLTQLSDIHNVYAYFSLSEDDFVSFKSHYEGKTLQEKISHLPQVNLVLADDSVYAQAGKVDMVDGQFNKSTAAITLRASFPNALGTLRSGNTGKVRLALQHKNISLVPMDATLEIQDKIFVYAVGDSNKVAKQPIQIAGKSGNFYLVSEGVKAGDRIVTEGIDHLLDGQVIKPTPIKHNKALAYSSK